MSTLLVDNYDSYTYNVFHLLAAVSGEEPIVIHNDMVSWRALSRWDFDAIVLSPGPGRPQRWHDFGVCSDILRFSEIPVLGICLGHQGLGHVLSGMVATAPMAMHGRLSQVQHLGSGLFAGIPQDFSVVRYHSLAVTGPLGPEGRVTAWTDDGVVMGIEHRSRPLWGVQFHPESVATEHGRALVENFYALARRHRPPRSQPARAGPRPRRGHRAHRRRRASTPRAMQKLELRVRSIAGRALHRAAVRAAVRRGRARLLARQRGCADAAGAVLLSGHERGRGPCVLEYDVEARTVSVRRAGASKVEHGSIFDVLERELAAARSSRRRGWRAAWSAASSAISATSARPTAARPTCTAPTCPTPC